MRIGPTEILLIVILALVLFGGKRLAGVGKSLGQSIREFKEELGDDKDKPAEQPTEEPK